jgi:hypothetical protein
LKGWRDCIGEVGEARLLKIIRNDILTDEKLKGRLKSAVKRVLTVWIKWEKPGS